MIAKAFKTLSQLRAIMPDDEGICGRPNNEAKPSRMRLEDAATLSYVLTLSTGFGVGFGTGFCVGLGTGCRD